MQVSQHWALAHLMINKIKLNSFHFYTLVQPSLCYHVVTVLLFLYYLHDLNTMNNGSKLCNSWRKPHQQCETSRWIAFNGRAVLQDKLHWRWFSLCCMPTVSSPCMRTLWTSAAPASPTFRASLLCWSSMISGCGCRGGRGWGHRTTLRVSYGLGRVSRVARNPSGSNVFRRFLIAAGLIQKPACFVARFVLRQVGLGRV